MFAFYTSGAGPLVWTVMHVAVRVLSILGIVVHGVYIFLCIAASGLSDGPPAQPSAWIPFMAPFLYFGYCFVTSFRRFKGTALLVSGILAQLIVAPFYIRCLKEGAGLIAVLPLVLAGCWYSMYFRGNEEQSA